MDDFYHVLREFAASWWLVFMMAFFVGTVLFALRPGSKELHRHIAETPLRDDDPRRLDTSAEQER